MLIYSLHQMLETQPRNTFYTALTIGLIKPIDATNIAHFTQNLAYCFEKHSLS